MSCQPRKNIFHYKNLKNIPTTNFAKHSHLFLLYLFLKTLKKFKQQNFSNLESFYQSGISRTYLSRQPIALSATFFKNLTKTKFEKSCKLLLTKIYKNLKNVSLHQRKLRRIVSPSAKIYHKPSQNFSQPPQKFPNLNTKKLHRTHIAQGDKYYDTMISCKSFTNFTTKIFQNLSFFSSKTCKNFKNFAKHFKNLQQKQDINIIIFGFRFRPTCPLFYSFYLHRFTTMVLRVRILPNAIRVQTSPYTPSLSIPLTTHILFIRPSPASRTPLLRTPPTQTPTLHSPDTIVSPLARNRLTKVRHTPNTRPPTSHLSRLSSPNSPWMSQ